MKTKHSLSLAAAAIMVLPASHLLAQSTGTSHPESDSEIVATGGTHYVKPSSSAACPPPSSDATVRAASTDDTTVYGPYKPYVAPGATAPTAAPATIASGTTPVVYGGYQPYTPAGQTAQLSTRPQASADGSNTVSSGFGEVPTGTTLTGVLQQTISTRTTLEGTHFMAVVSVPVIRDGVIIVPAGSLIKGRITRIHGGRRISGPPQIRIQPETISMLDGTVYQLSADVTGLDHFYPAHVNHEGTIVGTSSGKNTALAFGLLTGSSTVSGAVVGGGVGAVVGAGVGMGIATVWWLRQDRLVEVPSGTKIVFTLENPLQITAAAH
jgi:hypothetical protein